MARRQQQSLLAVLVATVTAGAIAVAIVGPLRTVTDGDQPLPVSVVDTTQLIETEPARTGERELRVEARSFDQVQNDGSGPDSPADDGRATVDSSQPRTTSPATSPPSSEETAPPQTYPPVTEPPPTEPTVTNPPATEPTVTEPPPTQPTVTEPPPTQPTVTSSPTSEPPRPTVTLPPITIPRPTLTVVPPDRDDEEDD